MTKDELNSLVIEYQRTKSEDVFRIIYYHFYPSGCSSDVLGIYDEVIFKSVMKYDPKVGDFENFFRRCFYNAKSTEGKKKTRIRSRETSFSEIERDLQSRMEDIDFQWEPPDEYNLEQDVIDRACRKKDADKRKLIDHMVIASNADDVTMAVVTNFPQYKSLSALARALGLHHEVVRRKLRRLSEYYDPHVFGDYRDYLVVC